MKTDATPTEDETHVRIETYLRTASDGDPELVFYNPRATHEWVNAAESSTVALEEWR
ncbi:hypothetical protein [Halorussus salinus]|uniref:hypothetical protein n=1 Tax=Halorussus salinus TaxID=1364935 RepID=UPI00138F298D|nr:hypothetical protein [Halorussus salinus]